MAIQDPIINWNTSVLHAKSYTLSQKEGVRDIQNYKLEAAVECLEHFLNLGKQLKGSQMRRLDIKQ